MFWVALFVPVGAASIVLLGLLTWRLWRQVRQFGRDVAAAGERINRVNEELQRVQSRASGR
ncbi:MAG TPA: hypothetical protein VH274_03040 [Mycobacteriales bacterium]|nr:hypothetical protein [Mycobacteriales bacterium]